MNHKFKYSLILVFIFMLPILAFSNTPPHDALSGVSCNACHSFYGTILHDEQQETMCKSCHSATGMASSKIGISNHVVNDGATIIDCGHCHFAHNPVVTTNPNNGNTSPNLSLVRGGPSASYNNAPAAITPFIFQVRPTDFAFPEGTANYVAICQVCHTNTAYHTNDGSTNHNHGVGMDCTTCHSHANGFLAEGGDCVSCHSIPQDNGDNIPVGGRRAVTGEFPGSTSHAHFGRSLDVSDCLVCHSIETHADGYIELLDMDDPTTFYRFSTVADLPKDPDLSDFCSGCHDADGATILGDPMNPFGDGNAPPDVATKFQGTLQWNEWYGDWCFGEEGTMRPVNSHHDISDADQEFSGAKLECINCHGSHSSSLEEPVIDPFVNPAYKTNSPSIYTTTGEMNDFCISCHSGGSGPDDPGFPEGVLGPDSTPVLNPYSAPTTPTLRGLESCGYGAVPWYVDYTWTNSAHGKSSKREWLGYSGAPSAVVECLDCHDSHGSYTETNTAGNPYFIRDFVYGSKYIDDGTYAGGFNGPPWNTTGVDREVVVSISGTTVGWGDSNGLCSACHASWFSAYSWHSYCNGCQTCHGHGQLWNNYDWHDGNDDMYCGKVVADKSVPGESPQKADRAFFSKDQIELIKSTPPCNIEDKSLLPPIHRQW